MTSIFTPGFLARLGLGKVKFPTHGDQADPKARLWEWTKALAPHVSQRDAEAAARLFPATSVETFQRWLGLRSAITEADEHRDPLLTPDPPDRMALRPLRFPWMVDTGGPFAKNTGFRKLIETLHWMADEVDVAVDAVDITKASKGEATMFMHVLAFFNIADTIVIQSLEDVATTRLPHLDAAAYFAAVANQEMTHADAYSQMVTRIIPREHREKVMQSLAFSPAVGMMVDWVRWWIEGRHASADVFAMMAHLEGTLFSGMFAMIQYFKTRNLFPGSTTYNEMISRDENVHTLWWCYLLKQLKRRPDPPVEHGIAAETVRMSAAFLGHAIPAPLAGLNKDLLMEYVNFTARQVLTRCGAAPGTGEKNPLSFMTQLALNATSRTNFFERDVTQYQAVTGGDLAFEISPGTLQLARKAAAKAAT
jgi:ribonucleotide reductase beta subunit family protein with ferritin-like domain